MRAYILSIGSELILGHLTDTNATFLAQELSTLGIELLHVVQCGDDRERLTRTIANAVADADLVICSGGIGPTGDDLTREAISDVAGETPEIDPELLTTLEAFFARRGSAMPERNKKQAWLIPSAQTLANPVGTAPGWFVEVDGTIIVAMPGVPREMFRMWREQVVPRLQERLPQNVIRTVRIKTIGIGESAAEQELVDLIERPNPVIATYAKDDGVYIHVTGVAATEDEAVALRDLGRSGVYERLGEYIYGEDETSLESAILARAAAVNLNLSIVDAGGGGRFASMLLTHDGAWASIVHSTNVQPSEATAAEIAARSASPGVLAIGIAVRHTTTPEGFVEGTIEVATAGAVEESGTFPFRGAYPELQRRSGMVAADVVLKALRSIGS
ncbi:CinA family nicotinamide mononucleotide deamidase-related protein [soil metagenome]